MIEIDIPIDTPMLRRLAEEGAEDLVAAIADKEPEIKAAIRQLTEEAKESQEPVRFKASFALTLDLDKNAITTAFSFSVKSTVKVVTALTDEGPELPWKEGE